MPRRWRWRRVGPRFDEALDVRQLRPPRSAHHGRQGRADRTFEPARVQLTPAGEPRPAVNALERETADEIADERDDGREGDQVRRLVTCRHEPLRFDLTTE